MTKSIKISPSRTSLFLRLTHLILKEKFKLPKVKKKSLVACYMPRRKKYRKLSFITDIRGIKNAIGEMNGWGFPKQPKLNKNYKRNNSDPLFNEEWFIETLRKKIATHPDNSMEGPNLFGEKMFDEPLVDFVSGDDPILKEYKKIIGPFHLTPFEIMKWQAEKNGIKPPREEDLSIVSFILPFVKETKDGNAKSTEWPTERWAQTRLLGEIFSQTIVREIVTLLMSKGVLAVSPDVTPFFNKKRYPEVGWASPWSHRHMAYAAGLGTFGLQDFLITEKGAAHRCGSFVVNLKLKPQRKRSDDIHAYCLQYQGINCMKCVGRCPVGAINKDGHDKEKCSQRVSKTLGYVNRNYHIFIYGCGLCSVGTPCESGIPQSIKLI